MKLSIAGDRGTLLLRVWTFAPILQSMGKCATLCRVREVLALLRAGRDWFWVQNHLLELFRWQDR